MILYLFLFLVVIRWWDDVLVQLITHNLHEIHTVSLADDAMHNNQSLNPLYITTTLQLLQNNPSHLVPIFLIFLLFFIVLGMVIDVDVDLIVVIVMDIDIDVKIVILRWRGGGEVTSCEVGYAFGEDHFVGFVDFAVGEELLDLGVEEKALEHKLCGFDIIIKNIWI